MVGIKNSSGSLGLVLFGLTVNKNIDCILVIENVDCILIKQLSNQQLISWQAIVTSPCVECFCQFIGIALLFNPDPFIVNLFLYYYEQECLLQTEKWDLQKAQIFSSIFRFIDNPCSFSNDVYPDELILEKENEDLFQALFLDLLIEVCDRIENLPLSSLIKAFPFLFTVIICKISCTNWIAIYQLKYFMLESVLKFCVLLGKQLINLVRHVNQGIIQKKSSSGSRMLPLVVFDQKVPFFPKIVLS